MDILDKEVFEKALQSDIEKNLYATTLNIIDLYVLMDDDDIEKVVKITEWLVNHQIHNVLKTVDLAVRRRKAIS